MKNKEDDIPKPIDAVIIFYLIVLDSMLILTTIALSIKLFIYHGN